MELNCQGDAIESDSLNVCIDVISCSPQRYINLLGAIGAISVVEVRYWETSLLQDRVHFLHKIEKQIVY